MKAEVGEQSNVLGSFLALGEFGKDQETLPTLALSESDTLEANGNGVEVAFSYVSSFHNAVRAEVLEGEIDEGGDDGNGKDPF